MKTFKMFCWCLVLTVFVQFSNCKVSKIPPAEFVHQTNGKVAPWSHERFDNDNDKFCFAIISDLYGGERPGIFKVAINQINLLHPEFIMSVGDLIDGGTEDKNQLSREWNEFDNKAALAHAPVFYAGGNHDLTNVVMREVWA